MLLFFCHGIVILILIFLAVTGAVVIYLLLVYPRVDFKKLPVLEGITGENYLVKDVKGIPLLLYNGMPYPTFFDETSRKKISLNGTWKMRFDPDDEGLDAGWNILTVGDENWMETIVPSTYNADESPFREYSGVTWYMKEFPCPDIDLGNEYIRLCFEGVLLRSTVWLNGSEAGRREGGYTPFYFDVTTMLKPGNNILIVRSDNRLNYHSLPPRIGTFHKPGWHTYGGIYRNVYFELMVIATVCKADIRYEPDNETPVSIDIITHTRRPGNPAVLHCRAVTPGNETAWTGSHEFTHGDEYERTTFYAELGTPELWSPENPALYAFIFFLESGMQTDTVTVKTGFREIIVTNRKIQINKKDLFLKGICKHEDDPVLGHTQSDETISRDLEQLREMNANYIRLVHYPHDTRELTAARDKGFLLSEEIPFYQAGTGIINWFAVSKKLREFPFRVFGAKQMNSVPLLKNAQRELVEMIERDRNNPSIILWGLGNETYTLGDGGSRAYQWLADTARSLDSSRPVTMADLTYNCGFIDRMRSAGRYVDIPSYNIYSGWYYGKTGDIKKQLRRAHSLFPEKPVILSEFGAGAVRGRSDSDGVWDVGGVIRGKTFSEDYQASLLVEYISTARETGFTVGVSPWVHADFLCMEFPHNPVPNSNLKGVVTKDRIPKKSFLVLKKIYGRIT